MKNDNNEEKVTEKVFSSEFYEGIGQSLYKDYIEGCGEVGLRKKAEKVREIAKRVIDLVDSVEDDLLSVKGSLREFKAEEDFSNLMSELRAFSIFINISKSWLKKDKDVAKLDEAFKEFIKAVEEIESMFNGIQMQTIILRDSIKIKEAEEKEINQPEAI